MVTLGIGEARRHRKRVPARRYDGFYIEATGFCPSADNGFEPIRPPEDEKTVIEVEDAVSAPDYFLIPSQRVVELGTRVEI